MVTRYDYKVLLGWSEGPVSNGSPELAIEGFAASSTVVLIEVFV